MLVAKGEKVKILMSELSDVSDFEGNPNIEICYGISTDKDSMNEFFDIDDPRRAVLIHADEYISLSDSTNLTMRNTNPFAYTEELDIEWKILMGGQTIVSGRGSIGEIEPYGSRTLRFPFEVEMFLTPGWAGDKPEFVEMYAKGLSHELVFDITLKLHKDTYYARAGYEVAFFQEILAEEMQEQARPSGTVLSRGHLLPLPSSEQDLRCLLMMRISRSRLQVPMSSPR